jgi:hypothetical protein
MKSWIGLTALILSAPALAGNYKVVLDRPPNGRLLTGHMGLQAADEQTPYVLVRVVAPGNTVDVRGTIRVLVANLGTRTFTVGPDQVTLQLGDGTILKPVPIDAFEKRKDAAEQENGYARAIDLRNRNDLSSLERGSSASTPGTPQAMPTGETADTASQDYKSDSDLLPHAEALNAIYQLLIPLDVGPRQAWGGYYVFDVPKAVQRAHADHPLTITVRTGGEVHRFTGTLRWR